REVERAPELLVPRARAHAPDAQLLVQGEGDLLEVRPGPGRRGQLDARLLEGVRVEHPALRVGPEIDRHQLAVHHATLQERVRDVAGVDGAALDVLVEWG